MGTLEVWLSALVRAKRPARMPVVLTRDEVRAVLERLPGVCWLVGVVLYGAGVRLLEALRLRVKDVDFAANEIMVRGGKGDRRSLASMWTVRPPSGGGIICMSR